MAPRFGGLTRGLAVLFGVASAGALPAGLYAGEPADRAILLTMGIVFLAVGAGIWMAYPWAWWAGLIVTTVTVVGTIVAGLPIGEAVVWTVALVSFGVSALQGRADRSGAHLPN